MQAYPPPLLLQPPPTTSSHGLCRQVSYLSKKNESAKLDLFRKFRAVLVVSVLFSAAWSLYTVAASADGYFEVRRGRHPRCTWTSMCPGGGSSNRG